MIGQHIRIVIPRTEKRGDLVCTIEAGAKSTQVQRSIQGRCLGRIGNQIACCNHGIDTHIRQIGQFNSLHQIDGFGIMIVCGPIRQMWIGEMDHFKTFMNRFAFQRIKRRIGFLKHDRLERGQSTRCVLLKITDMVFFLLMTPRHEGQEEHKAEAICEYV